MTGIKEDEMFRYIESGGMEIMAILLFLTSPEQACDRSLSESFMGPWL